MKIGFQAFMASDWESPGLAPRESDFTNVVSSDPPGITKSGSKKGLLQNTAQATAVSSKAKRLEGDFGE